MRRLSSHFLLAVIASGILFVSLGRGQYLEAVIPVGHDPLGVLWNPTSNKVYAANYWDGTVSVIDGATNQVLATVAVGEYPWTLCWNSANNKVYATCRDPDWVYVIDGVGDSVTKRIRTRANPTHMAYNAAMNKLYVQCIDDRMVRVYDGAEDTLIAEVWLGATPSFLMMHPVSNRVFCSLAEEDSILTIDCASDEVTGVVHVGGSSGALCWNRVNNLVYVDCDNGIHVLSAAGDSVVGVIPAHGDMTFAPYPNKIFAVTSAWTYVIDCGRQSVLDSLPCYGYAAVCDTIRGKVYTAASNGSYVLDARADSLLSLIQLGTGLPQSIAWNPTYSRVYIGVDAGTVLYVIRDTSVAIAEPVGSDVGSTRVVAAIVRGSLLLPAHNEGRETNGELLDISGRKVLDLHPGPNDVSRLAPGVYFVREAQAQAQAVHKVVIGR